MAPLVSTLEIGCSPEEVFAFATDPLRFAEWQRDVVGVRMLGDARFATTRRFGGAERTMTQQIIRNDPPRSWAARGIDGPLRPHATVTVEPIDQGARSRVTFTLDFEGHGVGVPLVPLVRRQAGKGAPASYRNLKTLLESGSSRPGSDHGAAPPHRAAEALLSTRGSAEGGPRRIGSAGCGFDQTKPGDIAMIGFTSVTATGRRTAYWAATVLVTAELAVGGVWDVQRAPQVRTITDHLGYPSYFLVMLGVWKLLGALALLAPRFPLLKEWAYAGVIFTDTGAIASHLTVGYAVGELAFLIPLTGLTVLSWSLRPPSRRLPLTKPVQSALPITDRRPPRPAASHTQGAGSSDHPEK